MATEAPPYHFHNNKYLEHQALIEGFAVPVMSSKHYSLRGLLIQDIHCICFLSLHYIKRQNEMDKISRENQAILHRIQTVRPQYSTRKWEGDYEVHKTRTKALSLFPPIEVCGLL